MHAGKNGESVASPRELFFRTTDEGFSIESLGVDGLAELGVVLGG